MDQDRIRVLLIEDDEDDYILTCDLLRESGARAFDITWANCLAQGVRYVSDPAIDVVLVDLSLPDSQGLETFRKLHEAADHVPMILLTGLDDESLGMHAVQAGAQDYLIKGSIDSHLLVRAVLYAIERKKTKEELASYARELKLRTDQMADDLAMAREVQQAFLPQQYPVIPPGADEDSVGLGFCHVYLPSTLVGGDFYTVLQVSETSAGVFICDVMGHGMRAALVTAIIRGLVEELRGHSDDPGRFLTEVNLGLVGTLRHLEQMVFASAFYVTVDVTTGGLRYACAGHPRPLRARPSLRTAVPLSMPDNAGGPALGILEAVEYRTVEETLLPEDLLILFTDGLFEVKDRALEEFGVDRLAKAVEVNCHRPALELLNHVVSDARAFADGQPFDDDVCMVAVELLRLSGGDVRG